MHDQLFKEYPNVKFPDTAIQFMIKNVADIMSSRKSCSLEERRNNLQRYLADLALVPMIKESATFRKFLRMDIECHEEYEALMPLSKSYAKENISEPLSPNE